MKTMFCPKCGADGQSAEAYCKRCGEWLPDIDAIVNRKIFRKLTREEKIEKMRILEMISAGLSLVSAAIIISILAGGNDTKLLFLAVICCLLVAVYQTINFYLGHKLHSKTGRTLDKNIDEIETRSGKITDPLKASDAIQLTGRHSVTENTTDLLEPVPAVRSAEQKK